MEKKLYNYILNHFDRKPTILELVPIILIIKIHTLALQVFHYYQLLHQDPQTLVGKNDGDHKPYVKTQFEIAMNDFRVITNSNSNSLKITTMSSLRQTEFKTSRIQIRKTDQKAQPKQKNKTKENPNNIFCY